jgi:XTP/dITP diphosphohydrolase
LEGVIILGGEDHPDVLSTLVVATTNPGKLREIRRLLGSVPIALHSLSDFAPVVEPEETGRTFAENAMAKAIYYAQHTGVPTVAEDSGLVVDAIGGRPGVESARYPGATYADKFANLYRELSPHRRPWRARFVCSVAVVDPARVPTADRPGPNAERRVPTPQPLFTCEATVEGEIAPEPRGAHGFGYDPIFFFPPYGRTFGEVDDQEKLAVAHRGKAFRQLGEWITDFELQRSKFEV